MSASPTRLLYCGEVRTGPLLLRDSGHEVVVLDPSVPAAQVAAIAVQEDVDLVAVEDAELGAAVADHLRHDRQDHPGDDVLVFAVVFSITSASGPS